MDLCDEKTIMLRSIEKWRKKNLLVAQGQQKAVVGFEQSVAGQLLENTEIVRLQYNREQTNSMEIMPCIL